MTESKPDAGRSPALLEIPPADEAAMSVTPAPRNKTQWQPWEDGCLIWNAHNGDTLRQIGLRLERSEGSCRMRLQRFLSGRLTPTDSDGKDLLEKLRERREPKKPARQVEDKPARPGVIIAAGHLEEVARLLSGQHRTILSALDRLAADHLALLAAAIVAHELGGIDLSTGGLSLERQHAVVSVAERMLRSEIDRGDRGDARDVADLRESPVVRTGQGDTQGDWPRREFDGRFATTPACPSCGARDKLLALANWCYSCRDCKRIFPAPGEELPDWPPYAELVACPLCGHHAMEATPTGTRPKDARDFLCGNPQCGVSFSLLPDWSYTVRGGGMAAPPPPVEASPPVPIEDARVGRFDPANPWPLGTIVVFNDGKEAILIETAELGITLHFHGTRGASYYSFGEWNRLYSLDVKEVWFARPPGATATAAEPAAQAPL